MARIAATGGGVTLPSQAVLIARDGREIPIGDSVSPIQTADGTLLGIVVVFRDTTAERDAERQRAAALEREQAARRTAESLSRAKDEFVATVSHELRTPLNAIYGWVAMLRLGALDAAGQVKAIEVIDRNTRVQAQLIEDLLDMARVIRGTVRLDMLPVDLAVAVESAVDAVMPAADARRVKLRVNAPRGVAFVSGDSSRLQQIVWNLLSNAIKFSDAGDEVEVTLTQEGDDAVLRVRDSGAGIDPAFLPHVFERFRQETSDVTREHAGLGLGLSLVRHLAELHGGTVTAESPGKTLGSTFTVRLPLIGVQAGRPLAADAGEAAATTTEPLPHVLQHLHVLAVDDDRMRASSWRPCCSAQARRWWSAASVRDAIAAIASRLPDVVLTDIAMPHATGFDLVRQLRATPEWSEIPVIALTAYARAEDRAQALSLGFTAHLGKPFSPRALVALVAEVGRRVRGSGGSAGFRGFAVHRVQGFSGFQPGPEPLEPLKPRPVPVGELAAGVGFEDGHLAGAALSGAVGAEGLGGPPLVGFRQVAPPRSQHEGFHRVAAAAHDQVRALERPEKPRGAACSREAVTLAEGHEQEQRENGSNDDPFTHAS